MTAEEYMDKIGMKNVTAEDSFHELTNRVGYRKAKAYIEKLCKLFTILDTSGYDIENALAYDDKDFEDSVMISTAIRCGMDGIITRNTKDYLNHGIDIFNLSEYRNLL